MILAWALLFLGTGCAAVRNRIVHRTAECRQLCAEARQAREKGKNDEAEELLNAALRRKPKDADTRLELADEMWSGGRQLAAADLVAQVVAEHPDDPQACLKLAQMEFEIGRTEASQSALRLCLMADPEHPEALRLKAKLEERRGDFEAAVATYQRLTQILPDDVPAQLAFARAHIQRGQTDRAAPILRGVAQHPLATAVQRQEAEWELGICYAKAERWSDAVTCLQSGIPGRSASAENWYQLAVAQALVGNQESAYASISHTLELDPNHAAARRLARSIRLGESLPPSNVVPAGFSPMTAAPSSSSIQ